MNHGWADVAHAHGAGRDRRRGQDLGGQPGSTERPEPDRSTLRADGRNPGSERRDRRPTGGSAPGGAGNTGGE